ncbi:RlmE family RNA methyltransferase [Candidatus Bathyarchaeota archaeon]|nr:RlmE family RNA methyltransferase [Candidatus Bathyarchaeota archaeon]
MTAKPERRKSLIPKAWNQNRKQEFYYRKAKRENYRSRASYKLAQAINKYHFINRNDIVVDLGAAPGGWIQVARKKVGKRGFVLGVDLKPIDPFEQEYIRTIIADINSPSIVIQIQDFLPRNANVVISDAAPNISGIWEVDQAKQIDLADKALEISLKILKPSGNFFTKVFEGAMLNNFIKKVEKYFTLVKLIKPKASRAKSAEMYLLAIDMKSDKKIENKNKEKILYLARGASN